MTATAFALSTIATMVAVTFVATLLCPMSLGIRLLPSLNINESLQILPIRPIESDVAGAIGAVVLLYVMSRLTRNATLEVDRVRTPTLRKVWMAFFEVLWLLLFVLLGEMLATCVDGMLPAPACGLASWGFLVAVASARCLLARHDHHGRHSACEALRSVGRSAIACVAWASVSLVALPYGVSSDPVALGVLAAVVIIVALLVIGPCLAEGRHRGTQVR